MRYNQTIAYQAESRVAGATDIQLLQAARDDAKRQVNSSLVAQITLSAVGLAKSPV
jgi:hypothetical protein